MVVELYIIIRGHWFVKTEVEKYKQDNKESIQNIQKSKSLRKTVISSTKPTVEFSAKPNLQLSLPMNLKTMCK